MIGGNITADIQVAEAQKNRIGEQIQLWKTVQSIRGWLDLSGGESGYQSFNAKVQESTHIFISDFIVLDDRINAENSRMDINGRIYDIMLIDNPMELNKQLEIYLKFTGGR